MCLSIPGKIIEIKKDGIVIDYISEIRTVNTSAIDVSVGDYVLVSNKIIFNKVDSNKAKEYLKLIQENGNS